jgi:hypothetical protein
MSHNPFHPYPMPKLTIELVPATQWGDNLRSHLAPSQWDNLRRACYTRADNKCECCGGVGKKHPVECHEIWDYNDSARIQTLIGLVSLCPACHQVKHIGRALATGNGARAMTHLMSVNKWPEELAEAYVVRQFEIHDLRSRFEWTIDLAWLEQRDAYIAEAAVVGREARSKRVQAMMLRMTRTVSDE